MFVPSGAVTATNAGVATFSSKVREMEGGSTSMLDPSSGFDETSVVCAAAGLVNAAPRMSAAAADQPSLRGQLTRPRGAARSLIKIHPFHLDDGGAGPIPRPL
jgi:hypothetical protein